MIRTDGGRRFVDAPEVGRITNRRVLLTITAAEVAELPGQPGLLSGLRRRLGR